ncbi:uncharacterized protein RJT20DRAFT_126996 [Scheffersomyces xylosifermentans]|uniref:uncharacterized protein n=1 Tax=Scheffersomyces xylosifermentans TaxID=1304137 RepID=UPI00315CE3E1
MDRNRLRINLKTNFSEPSSSYNNNSSSASTIREGTSSRSRSRSPHKDRKTHSTSPLKARGGSGPSGVSHSTPLSPKTPYRERSQERSTEKFQKSSLYKKENTSLVDLPLSNSSYNNPIKNPEFQQEQDQRGRARSRDETSTKDRDNSESMGEENISAGEEDDTMISLMGFSGFGTTKGKHVKATKGGATKKDKKTEYRQYMNRSKGFNRPLSPGR